MMKKILSYILLISLSFSVLPVSAQDDFQKGVQAYENEDFKTALEYFLRYNAPEAVENAAMCYYQLGEVDNAIHYAMKNYNSPKMMNLIAAAWSKKDEENEFSTGFERMYWSMISWFRGNMNAAPLAMNSLMGSDYGHHIVFRKMAMLSVLHDPDDPTLNYYLGESFFLGDNNGHFRDENNAKYWFKRAFTLADHSESVPYLSAIAKGMVEYQLSEASESKATVTLENLSRFAAEFPEFKYANCRLFLKRQDTDTKEDCIMFQTDVDVTKKKGKICFANILCFSEDGHLVSLSYSDNQDSVTLPYETTHVSNLNARCYQTDLGLVNGRHKLFCVQQVHCDGDVLGYSDIIAAYVTVADGRIISFERL